MQIMDRFNKLDININRNRINKLSRDLSLYLFEEKSRSSREEMSWSSAEMQSKSSESTRSVWMVGWGF